SVFISLLIFDIISISVFSTFYSFCFFFSSRRRHTRSKRDWSSDVCSSDLDFNIKLLLGISFLLFTAPIGGHLMARAAYLSGVEPDEITEKDELKEVVEEAKQKENIPNKE